MVDILTDIDSYRSMMTITQVIKFFNAYDMAFTKTMIQNYVRTNLIPPPVEQRYYTKEHLILLSVIYELKASFSLDEIKRTLDKIYKEDVEQFYRELISITKQLDSAWDRSIKKVNKESFSDAVMTAGIMVHSSSLKKKYLNCVRQSEIKN